MDYFSVIDIPAINQWTIFTHDILYMWNVINNLFNTSITSNTYITNHIYILLMMTRSQKAAIERRHNPDPDDDLELTYSITEKKSVTEKRTLTVKKVFPLSLSTKELKTLKLAAATNDTTCTQLLRDFINTLK